MLSIRLRAPTLSLAVAAFVCCADGAPALAQDTEQPDAKVTAMVDKAKATYGPEAPRKRCEGGSGDEIVVCARGDSSQFRVPSSNQSNPRSRSALSTGMPSAPQLDRGSCKGQPNCIVGGWAPPPVYYVDLKAIPEAPEGSEADLVAKGEKKDR